MPSRPLHADVESRTQRLNQETRRVTRCAWPGCDDMYGQRNPQTGEIIYNRVGILCWKHADLIADAVLEDRVRVLDFQHHELTAKAADAQQRDRERERRDARQKELADAVRGDKPGFVYYLQVGERIKIGYSTDVKKRMRAYPPGSKLLAVEGGSPQLEAQRHREFAGSLVDGREWFRPDEILLEHIDRTAQMDSDGRQFAHHYRANRQPMRQVRRRKYR